MIPRAQATIAGNGVMYLEEQSDYWELEYRTKMLGKKYMGMVTEQDLFPKGK